VLLAVLLALLSCSQFCMYFNRIVFNAIAVLHCLGLVFLRAVIRATLVVALLSCPTVFSLLLIVIYCGQINDDDDKGPESFHGHFNAQFTSPHSTFFIFWDEIVKQQTVTYVTMNDLNAIAPITILLNADDSNAFSVPGRSSNSSSCALSAIGLQLCCGIRFIGEVQRLLPRR